MSASKFLRVTGLIFILLVTLVGPGKAGAASDSSAQAFALGASGTSFRYVQTFGVADEAYPADARYLNGPNGMFIDGSDNLYVVEELGARLLKYRLSDNANLLSIGKAGFRDRESYTFDYPKDVTLDAAGHIWEVDNQRAAEYSASGVLMQEFPSNDPWNSGSDNTHFNDPRGIVFDSTGRMYVSDRNNHRVQVYDMGSGSPVYSATIGVTGVTGTDNDHFNSPTQIAMDGSDRLYVLDMGNYRVQRCTYAAGDWTCVTFFGETGVPGTDLNHLANFWSNGLVVKGSDVYIADSLNNRVLKCNLSGVCTLFAGASDGSSGTDLNHFYFPDDVAVDSHGNVYVSDVDNHRILKFTSSGGTAVGMIGTTRTPYIPDTLRYNTPAGITVGADGSIYFTEQYGFRLVKLDAAGVQQWTVGQAGVAGSDNAHFGAPFQGMAGNVAVDGVGRVYVPDTANNRIQIFDAGSGAYITTWGAYGTGPSQFNCPAGVAVNPVNGDIYVADRCNNRVQVFNSSRVYKTQLGSGAYGSSNTQFAGLSGVAVDKHGNIFVVDTDNARVQKCTLSGAAYTCSTFVGVTGESGSDFGHLSWPQSVAVDASDQLFVADASNSRVQVFDSTGAYLTTLGGNWGPLSTGNMIEPMGVAVDALGNVFVAGTRNERIEKFSPGVPGWKQANLNGFGDRFNRGITSLEVFDGALYAGASNWDFGGSIWRSTDARSWTKVTEAGFGTADPNHNAAIIDMVEFNGQLYAGTGWNGAAQLWRSPNGTTWDQVVGDGFGIADNNGIDAMAVYGGRLYVGTATNSSSPQIWRSSTGNSSSWTNVTTGMSCGDCRNVTSLIVFNGSLYAALEAHTDPPVGIQIWRTANGTDWSQVDSTGFGSPDNFQTGGFAVFNGSLYIGTKNNTTGAQIWRSGNGSLWTQAVGDGFGNLNNTKTEALYVFGGLLYAAVNNDVTGMAILRSSDGTTWSQINPGGFGDSNNTGTVWDSSITTFNGTLFIGTWNWAGNGGEIWRMLHQVGLPLIIR